MKVTAIESIPHKAGLYRIAVDGKPLGYVSPEDIFDLGIGLGRAITSATYTKLTSRIKYTSFLYLALGFSARRLHSREEVITHLLAKGCDSLTAQEIADRLEKLGIIDERKLAETFVNDAKLKGTVSKKEIEIKLKKKRINRKTIADTLRVMEINEASALDALISKKKSQPSYAENPARLFRYLLSKGFSFEETAARIGVPRDSGHSRGSGHRTTLN